MFVIVFVFVRVCECVFLCVLLCVCWPAGPCVRAEFSFGDKQHVCRAIGSQHMCMEAMHNVQTRAAGHDARAHL